ncbi:hypothetical protein COCHEDRAFT_1178650 [Bipolaris maydis C5]|uniref:Uncharacterized protein n=2 Tax=Cochliobolus heterostrophus TaxID=5016 RepID=M2UQK7_COCH5|nr:hypothetical protein COCHEDRAFT_1178650 [Bipolaris maydis C5]KAJ5023952.1 hypothetical protein J3E73DRAFT_384310 [Bipolaris maydis]KAJ6206112.1 hypothetical protein PSV09DRAFT_1178650 [Bipolaris maydis]KAJ6268844.1 hypothetical protein PSV08DRAFT_226252 [Bipolaris maydis]KAJ6279654.1 hypothetical protein J3E71DRAFT_201078 [Bipolaris maydis]
MSATTPHRPTMAAYHTPSQTPSRRVLGNITPKALNTPQTQTKTYELSQAPRAESPLKHVTPNTPAHFVDKENLTTPNATVRSKKRGIEEVEGAEMAGSAKMLAHARDDSPSNTGVRLTADAIQKHTENNPIGLADPGSPTERATPSPSPEPEPELIQASQKSNQSFSDFLNYEMCASQKSDPGREQERPAALASAPPVAESKTKSRAEQLRTRLKFGLYKVKTNQVNKRDVDIIAPYEASALYSSNTINASRSTATTYSSESQGTCRVPNITISSPQRDQGPVFVKANLDPFRPISKLGPAPVQFALPAGGMNSSRTLQQYDITSSPPAVELPKSATPEQLVSPARNGDHYQMNAGSGMRNDEYRAGESARERLQRLKQQQYVGDSLSNSIGVQGDAAEGLLQLMQHSR